MSENQIPNILVQKIRVALHSYMDDAVISMGVYRRSIENVYLVTCTTTKGDAFVFESTVNESNDSFDCDFVNVEPAIAYFNGVGVTLAEYEDFLENKPKEKVLAAMRMVQSCMPTKMKYDALEKSVLHNALLWFRKLALGASDFLCSTDYCPQVVEGVDVKALVESFSILIQPRITYSFDDNENSIPEDNSEILSTIKVGQTLTYTAAAPGTGKVTYRVTRIDEKGAHGFRVKNTIRELQPSEVA